MIMLGTTLKIGCHFRKERLNWKIKHWGYLMKIFIIILVLTVSGCVSIQTPTSPPHDDVHSVTIVEDLPEDLPSGTAQFKQSQLIFIHADQASEFVAGLLVPVPFVTGIVVDYVKDSAAEDYEKRMNQLRVYNIVNNELASYDNLPSSQDGYKLYPLVFIEECYDDVYRLSLAYQLEKDGWVGRYYYHLPTTINTQDISAPPLDALDSIIDDLHVGARTLLDMVDRDLKGELTASGEKAKVGSLFIVGGKISGVVTPTILAYKNAQIIEETESSVTVSISGDPTGKARNGGMAYGVHYFEKSQLHTFEPEKS